MKSKDKTQELLSHKRMFEEFYFSKKQSHRLRNFAESQSKASQTKLKVLTLKSTLLMDSNSSLKQCKQFSNAKQYALFSIADQTAEASLIIQAKQSPRLMRVIRITRWRLVSIKHQDKMIVAIYVQRSDDMEELVSQQKFKQQVINMAFKHQLPNISDARQLSSKLNQFQSPQQLQRKRQLLYKTKPKQFNFKKDKTKISKIQSQDENQFSDDDQQFKYKNKKEDKTNGRERSNSADVKHKFKSNLQPNRSIKNKRSNNLPEINYSKQQNMNNIKSMIQRIEKQNKDTLSRMPPKYRKVRLNFMIRREMFREQYASTFKDKIQYQRRYEQPNSQDFMQNQDDSYSQSSYTNLNRENFSQGYDEREYR